MNAYLLEIDYDTGNEAAGNGCVIYNDDLDGNPTSNIVTWDDATRILSADIQGRYNRADRPNWQVKTNLLPLSFMSFSNIFTVTEGTLVIRSIFVSNSSGNLVNLLSEDLIITDSYTFNGLGYTRNHADSSIIIEADFDNTSSVIPCIYTCETSIKQLTSDYLPINGTYTRNKNLSYGLQTVACKLNGAGVPYAMADSYSLSFENNPDSYIDTHWRPDLDEYTIEQMVLLEDGTFEHRTLSHSSTEDKYYVDGAVVTPTPALPDSSTTLKITDTAVIGPKDKIKATSKHFLVYNTVEQPSQPALDVPRVLSSTILATQQDGIDVKWDIPMKATQNIKDAISVIIDGAAAVHPTSVVFHPQDPKEMGIIMSTPFTPGQVVTWSYDDQHPTEELASIYNVEADNQTYAVVNNATANAASADSLGTV